MSDFYATDRRCAITGRRRNSRAWDGIVPTSNARKFKFKRRRGTMSLQSANEFISTATSSPEIIARIADAITGKSPTDAAQAVSDLGRLNGFEFTAEDAIQARQAVLQSQRLSEDDLDGVAGGTGIQDQFGAKPVGGGFVSPDVLGALPSNETKPVLPGTGTISDVAAGW
jgi:hypothetical protein